MKTNRRFTALALALVASVATGRLARAQSADTLDIWSLVLEVHTCNVSNAGTNDRVTLLFGAKTVELDRGRNERDRNEVNSYELAPFLVGLTGASITDRPTLLKTGTDLWCFDELTLYVNGASTPLYEWRGVAKIDQQSGYSTSFQLPSLRTTGPGVISRWGATRQIPGAGAVPTEIDDTVLWTAADTQMGHYIRFEPSGRDWLRWGNLIGNQYVDIGKSGSRLSARFDMTYAGGGPNTISTTYGIGCGADGRYVVAPEPFDPVHSSTAGDTEAWIALDLVGRGIARMLDARAHMAGRCAPVSIAADGGVVFQ